MATDDHTRRKPSTDDQDTAEFGTAPVPEGILLKDRYLLIRQLNEGGFGTVHLAHDQQMHGRPVVVKIQINQRVDDPWFERKFSEEVRALSMIDHPGVVVAIDSGRTPDGKPFLVMQYVDGVTLRAVMNPDGMPLDRAAEILKQVGHALGAAHEKGIWHRDLKPENLMLQSQSDSGERVRLIDFGIATVADIKNKYQTTTRVAGSFLYMAPEQAIGQPSALTDIYAMGLIAYEMVTGRKPFIAENAVQLADLQRSGVRVKPSDLRPALSLAAERLILNSLEYDPGRRPRNARAFGDELHDALLDTGATRITAPAATGTAVRTKRRNGTVAAAVILAAIIYSKANKKPEASKAASIKIETPARDANAESAIELAFWNSVKDSAEPQLYREYLAKYPEGRFESLAKAKLEILARKAPAKPSVDGAKADSGSREEEVEIAIWNSVKDATEPQLYQDYLDKYPHGRFESVARTKLEIANTKARGKGRRGGRDASFPDMPDLRNLAAVNPKMAAELADWNALKDVKDSQGYRDYLKKYPDGMFASLARIKISASDKRGGQPEYLGAGEFPPPPPFDPGDSHERRLLPPLRPALSLDSYNGPLQGELHWSGAVPKSRIIMIQGGKPNAGVLTNELPRVPVTVEIIGAGAIVVDHPSRHNNWDRMVMKTNPDSPPSEIVIRWKVEK